MFPIHRLNGNVTEIFRNIVSADIPGNINKGLVNEINLIDEDSHITNVAAIYRNPHDGTCRVSLSSAYCQFLWLICDVFLKEIDLSIIKEECNKKGIDFDAYRNYNREILCAPKEKVVGMLQKFQNEDLTKYLDYLRRTLQLLDAETHQKQKRELELALSLIDDSQEIDIAGMNEFNFNDLYEQLSNSVYCFAIAFILLHELSHFALGHLDSQEERIEDEENADLSAFWDIYSDIPADKKFSANIGILCALFSLIIINPSLEEDGVHPREDNRIFNIYNQIKDDNGKYTVLLKRLFDFWGIKYKIKDYPTGLSDTEEDLYKIRDFIAGNSWK